MRIDDMMTLSTSGLGKGQPSVIFAKPQYKREQVNKAGDALIAYDPMDLLNFEAWEGYNSALPMINNWRSSHSYPLHTFAVTLRTYARKIDDAALIAQRIKRLSSIDAKLKRFPEMRLTQMQDIGGCRAVVRDVRVLEELIKRYKSSNIKHERATFDDYVASPKPSGYRGVHLVYRYLSDKQGKKIYNGLKVEIQLRSQFQHAWATAVETVGTFVAQALKSSVGDEAWLRFFSLMGTAIANRERGTRVPGTPENAAELRAELQQYAQELNVEARLSAYGNALKTLRDDQLQDAHYYLLVLDPKANQLTISGFEELSSASERYIEAEKLVRERPGTDAVLVSVDSLAALERAYPNYFADTRVFLELLEQAMQGRERKVVVKPRPEPEREIPSS